MASGAIMAPSCRALVAAGGHTARHRQIPQWRRMGGCPRNERRGRGCPAAGHARLALATGNARLHGDAVARTQFAPRADGDTSPAFHMAEDEGKLLDHLRADAAPQIVVQVEPHAHGAHGHQHIARAWLRSGISPHATSRMAVNSPASAAQPPFLHFTPVGGSSLAITGLPPRLCGRILPGRLSWRRGCVVRCVPRFLPGWNGSTRRAISRPAGKIVLLDF